MGALLRVELLPPPGRVLSVSPALEDLAGHPSSDWLSGAVALRALIHPDDQELAEALLRPAPAEDAAMNLRLRHRQGRYVCVRCTYRKRATEQGLELELGLQLAIGLRSEVEDRTILTNFIAMMENTDDYIYFKDRNHVFTGASQTLVSITEPSEHWTDLIGKTDYDVFPEEYADRYYSLEKRVFSGAVEVAQEIQPTLDNRGRRGWVDNRKYPIKDADGSIIGLFGVARDITPTKVAEDERREALERLQKIARLVPGAVYQFLLRPDGRASFPYISDAVRELYHASPEEAGADAANVFAAVHPDDLPELWASTRASARELTPWVNEHRVRFADGTIRYMFGRGTPQRLEDGSVLWHGFVSDITDATERKRTEADLRVAATAFETREGMMVTDAQGVILKVNRAFTAISGFGASEVVGRTPELLRSDRHEAAFYRARQRTLEQSGTWQGELWQRRKDGEDYPAWLTITAVAGSARAATHYVWAFTDETERRRLEEQLYHSQKLEAIGRLAGGIAHDFNNLLAVILSYSELALDGAPPQSQLREDLGEVKKAGERARVLTQQLLAFSRKQVLEPRTLDLNQVVANAEKLLRRLVGENIEVVTCLAETPWLVRADPGQLEQVIINLAINARDAMPTGGRLTVATANVVLGEAEGGAGVTPGSYVELSVADTGTGIEPAAQARLFEPFFTTKEKGHGTGLGLSMVYGIVKQSGGTVRVSSALGEGSTFKVYLPRTQGPVSPDVREPERGATGGAETVLVVEDEDAVRTVTRRILEDAGYTVLTASNGVEALEVSEAHAGPIHLVVTDVVMAKMGGSELVARLAHARPATRVLFISGHTDGSLGSQGVLDEGTNFLAKPFTPASLTSRVRSVLDSGRGRPSPRW